MKYIIMKYKKPGLWVSQLNEDDVEYIYDSYAEAYVKLQELNKFVQFDGFYIIESYQADIPNE